MTTTACLLSNSTTTFVMSVFPKVFSYRPKVLLRRMNEAKLKGTTTKITLVARVCVMVSLTDLLVPYSNSLLCPAPTIATGPRLLHMECTQQRVNTLRHHPLLSLLTKSITLQRPRLALQSPAFLVMARMLYLDCLLSRRYRRPGILLYSLQFLHSNLVPIAPRRHITFLLNLLLPRTTVHCLLRIVAL